MSENKKRKNQNTKEILGRSFDLYKKFLDNPSKKNLDAFMEVAENYKEAFIEDTPDFLRTSSKDLHTFIQVKVDDQISLDDVVQRKINTFDRKIKKWEGSGRPLKNKQILNRLMGHYSEQLRKPIQNSNSIRRDEVLSANPQRVEFLKGKGKGPLKLFSNYVNVPQNILKAYRLNITQDLTFLEFRIGKYRYVLERDENTGNQWVRPFPRRWYMEENENKGRIAWYEDRVEIQPLFREFLQWNPTELLGKKTDDFLEENDNKTVNFYNSNDFSSERSEEIFKKYSLNSDEFFKFIDKQNGYKFLFCESIQNRSPDQILRNKEVRWIDICFYNDTHLTIRSFTNDQEFMPKCRDYTNSDQAIPWVMTNEMPKLPFSIIKFFSEELEKDFLEKVSNEDGMSKKDLIYHFYKNPPKDGWSIEELAYVVKLDPTYTENVLGEILKEKKVN